MTLLAFSDSAESKKLFPFKSHTAMKKTLLRYVFIKSSCLICPEFVLKVVSERQILNRKLKLHVSSESSDTFIRQRFNFIYTLCFITYESKCNISVIHTVNFREENLRIRFNFVLKKNS